MNLRRTSLPAALYRPAQILGCDRRLVVFSMSVSVWMAGSADVIGVSSGLVFAFLSLYVFRRMAKADPLMREVYFRHIRYVGYYPPFSRPSRSIKKESFFHLFQPKGY